MPDEFYIYLGVYVLLAIIGILVQERDVIFRGGKGKKSGKGKKKGDKDEDIEEEYKHNDDEKPLIKKDKKHKK
jgi:hypothetical protein